MAVKSAKSKHLDILRNTCHPSKAELPAAPLRQWRQKLGYYSVLAAIPTIFASDAKAARAEVLAAPTEKRTISADTGKPGVGRNKSIGKLDFLRRWQSNYLLPHQKRNNLNGAASGDDCPGLPVPAGTYTASAPFFDVGDTTGANNTVHLLDGGMCFYCYSYDVPGPDLLYTFSINALGPSPEIKVTSDSGGYNPVVYILGACPDSSTVPSGHIQALSFSHAGEAVVSSGQLRSLNVNVPAYLFIDSAGPYTLKIQDLTVAPGSVAAAAPNPRIDFDGDNRADISVFRPSDATWYLRRSTAGFEAVEFGLGTDRLAPADFDGDGKTDIAVYRDGVWLWLNSSNGVFRQAGWGLAGDTPQPGDYTGDGRAELAVFRSGTWFAYNIVNGTSTSAQFGIAGDRPVAADYDGDGWTDHAVYRDGIWYVSRSTRGFFAAQFGIASDQLVPSDYDGDGATDLAVFRHGTWYLQRSTLGFIGFQFGIPGDVPVPDDYDGSGTADTAVYRNGVWYLNQSVGGFSAVQFGVPTDKPIPGAFLP